MMRGSWLYHRGLVSPTSAGSLRAAVTTPWKARLALQRADSAMDFVPPFDDYLLCGISTQLRHVVPDLDEILTHRWHTVSRSHLLLNTTR